MLGHVLAFRKIIGVCLMFLVLPGSGHSSYTGHILVDQLGHV